MKRLLFFFSLLMASLAMRGQQVRVVENPQRHFPKTVPAGNYSGITWLGGDRYAVVSDKAADDGFFLFTIKADTVTGELLSARVDTFLSAGRKGRDDEGIAYNPYARALYISGEDDNRIDEYRLDGSPTGKAVPMADVHRHLPANRGLEALGYDSVQRRLWTCNEEDTVFIVAYDEERAWACEVYKYMVDRPVGDKALAQNYAHGVGTVCPTGDGRLLVLEREACVPKEKLGAFVNCKLFLFSPDAGTKQLLSEWRTTLSLFGRSFANYEGMCLGPRLADGSRLLVLVADSQNQYAGVLRDWLKTFHVYGL